MDDGAVLPVNLIVFMLMLKVLHVIFWVYLH